MLTSAHDLLRRSRWESTLLGQVVHGTPKPAAVIRAGLARALTNALKHGTLSNEDGRVGLSRRQINGGGRLCID